MKQSWDLPYWIESRVARIISRQELNGFKFNRTEAYRLLLNLDNKIDILNKAISSYLSPEYEVIGNPVIKIFQVDGDYSRYVKKHYENPEIVLGPFTRLKWSDPDVDSRDKLIKQFLRLGWKPSELTDKGTPKITIKAGEPCPNLIKIGKIGELVSEYFILKHRYSLITGLINSVRKDGRVGASAISLGTNTGRMTHKVIVNLPRVSTLYGKEIRGLFISPPGKVLVGHDASALEARMEAHYTWFYDKGEHAKILLEGDIHQRNADIFKCSRVIAKTAKYALSYGCSQRKLAKTLECSDKEAKRIFNSFWDNSPALKRLRDDVTRKAERQGYILGIDGRKIFIRSPHSALNALFQSAGAIVMKHALILLEQWIEEHNLSSRLLGSFHDEYQYEVEEKDVDKHRELAVESIVQSGKFFKLNVPLGGESKVGKSWAETH